MKSRVNSNNQSQIPKNTFDSDRKWLRNHVQKGEHLGIQAACDRFNISDEEKVFEYIETKLYPNDSTGSDLVSILKKNDDNIKKRQRSKTKCVLPSALQQKLSKLLKDVENMEKRREEFVTRRTTIMMQISEDNQANTELLQQLEALEKKAKELNDKISREKEWVSNLDSNILSVEESIKRKNEEIISTKERIEEEKAWHVSLTKFEGIEIYTRQLPSSSEKMAIFMEIFNMAEENPDKFLKDLLNASPMEDVFLAAEYLFCYRKACEVDSKRKVYWHVEQSNVADILVTLPSDMINLVIEKAPS